MTVDPLAHVADTVTLEEGVVIEPFAVIKGNVHLKKGVYIRSHAYIEGNTEIGEGTEVYPGACIGVPPQDLKYDGAETFVRIGKHCQIREAVTINRSTLEGETVEIGDHCLLMAYSHVAHECKLGHRVILANGVMLAGHVEVGDYAIIGGASAVHQFARIGAHAMVGGMSRVTYDVPPFTLGAGSPYKMGGLNIVGLKRRDFSLEERSALLKAFKITYRNNNKLETALKELEVLAKESKHVKQWLDFCKSTERGLIGLTGGE